jgi:hypothetical protein
MTKRPQPLVCALVLAILSLSARHAFAQEEINPSPTREDWLALAKLPDFSGVWTPDVSDQNRQLETNPTPWTPEVGRQVAHLIAENEAGRPFLVLKGCLPHGMPSWMLISHNAFEILLTPGRVTMLGESDGNRMRRIYTDGRGHPADPDLTLFGHSIGHWEGDTLVVDTVGIAPESWIAVFESYGAPNNGDMHIVERFRLSKPDLLEDQLTITAPKVLTKPWTTTRLYHRQRARKYDIVEGECVQGNFKEGLDEHGNSIFVAIPTTADGSVAPRVQ